MNKKYLPVSIIVILILVGFGTILYSGETLPEADDSGSTPEKVNSVVQANNKFAFDLYYQLDNITNGGNIFYSPYSISNAMAMVFEGARKNTKNQIRDVFNYPEKEVRRPGFARIYNQLNIYNKDYQLHTANGLWAQEDYQFLDSYINLMKDRYGATVENVDFKNNAGEVTDKINNWVSDRTNNKITNLISKGSLNELTRLVLTNAIYFKGNWEKQFDREDTKEMDFYTNNGKIKVNMMYQKEDFNYAEFEKLKILEMPYKGKNLSMLVFLPKENYSLKDINFTQNNFEKWRNELREEEVRVFMPKFEFKNKYKLNSVLKKMGIKSAFNSKKANFSGMDGTNKLFINFVVHQAYVKVNEEGTEAAAATGVGVGVTAIPQVFEFKADHPFMFIIQQKQTGNILFMGKVINPLE